MSLQDVKQSLFETNLNFDSRMANDIYAFFTQNGIEVSKHEIYLQTTVAAAIISETKLMDKKYNKYSSGNNIGIETLMNHLNGQSKQQFLELMSSMVSKNSTLQQKLSSKINRVKELYRLFKKYRKSFQQLWQHTGIGMLVMNDLLSIFWVLYLMIKNGKEDVFEDFSMQLKLLIVLLKSIFQYWISYVPQSVVKTTVQSNFKVDVESFINEQFFLLHHVEYFNQVQNLFSMKYENQTLDFKRFSKNPVQIAKFLDDISNHFYKEIQTFDSDTYIDQISYLQLTKILADEPVRNQGKIDLSQTESNLNHVSQQNDSQLQSEDRKQNINEVNVPVPKMNNHFIVAQNLSEMTPLRERRDKLESTPCQNRIMNLQWIRNCLDYMRRLEANELFKKVFNFVQKQTLVDFEFKARKQLFFLVEEFTPKCLRKDNRVNDMLAFFKYLAIKIYLGHDLKQNSQMFSELKTFNAILCLSCDIFNFAYSAVVSSYRKQCEMFQVPLTQALKPINWIGKNIDKPTQVNKYLYSLEKRIVIKEIWEDQTGYKLLKSQQKFNESLSIGYNDMVVWRRLIKHIFDRIEELSREVKLEHKMIKRIQTTVETILKQKPFLLHKNKIDQIIVCCMTSFLSINQIHQQNQQKTLQEVFKDYNRMDLSFNENREGLKADGVSSMTLTQFYNEIFLPQIQDLVEQNVMETDFLLTPIRQSYIKSFKSSGEGIVTPFAKKYSQNKIDFTEPFRSVDLTSSPIQKLSDGLSMFKSRTLLSSPTPSYRAKLILQSQQQQMRDSQFQDRLQMEEESEEEESLPDHENTEKVMEKEAPEEKISGQAEQEIDDDKSQEDLSCEDQSHSKCQNGSKISEE